MHRTDAPALLRERVEIREARPADNEGLLALTRATPMAGAISLRIDRDPDFFALLRLRGRGKVFVAAREREIVGCFSAALRTVYLAGNPETVAYVGDLKVHPRFAGTHVALSLIRAVHSDLTSAGIGVCFSVVAEGNRRAMPLLEGRLGIPRFIPLGRFLVDELLPSPFFQRRSGRYRLEPARAADLPAVAALLDGFHRSRQFGPLLREEEIVQPFSHTFVARDGQKIVATITVSDMDGIKRNVLLGAPPSVKSALALLRIVAAPWPRFTVPRIGDALRLLTARHIACEEGHQAALEHLLCLARAEAFRRGFTCLVLGLHERDPLRSLVRRIPRFTFTSLAFAASLDDPGRLEKLTGGIPFEDYALV